MVSTYNSFRMTCHWPLKKRVSISARRRHKPEEKGSFQHGENSHLWTDSSASGTKKSKADASNYVIRFLTLTLNWMKVQAQRLDLTFAKCHNQSLLLGSKMSWLLRMK